MRLTSQVVKRKGTPKPWAELFRFEWNRRLPGCKPTAKDLHQVTPVYDALDWIEATRRVTKYMWAVSPQYWNFSRFASTHATWADEAPIEQPIRPQPKPQWKDGKKLEAKREVPLSGVIHAMGLGSSLPNDVSTAPATVGMAQSPVPSAPSPSLPLFDLQEDPTTGRLQMKWR